MATAALASSSMSAIYYARHRASVAIGVAEIRMTPEAKPPARVDGN